MGEPVTTTLMAFGTLQSAKAAKKTERAQRERVVQEKRLADIKAQRARRKLIREARIKQADITTATAGGVSTREVGAAASVATQTAGGVGFLAQQQQISGSIFDLGGQIAEAQAQGAVGQSIFQIGQMSTTFGKPKKT
jgi:hypothetical protein